MSPYLKGARPIGKESTFNLPSSGGIFNRGFAGLFHDFDERNPLFFISDHKMLCLLCLKDSEKHNALPQVLHGR